MLSSVLIDLDHIPDYIVIRKGWRGVDDFFSTFANADFSKIYLVLHAWEWPILLAAGWALGIMPALLMWAGVGMFYHLFFDTIGNWPSPLPRFYWIFYRVSQGFSVDKMFRGHNRVEAQNGART